MATEGRRRSARLSATLRHDERVAPLELFFDLVFVLAITQCTALMASQPTWEGVGRGLLVLGVLWWSWVGYAWLTSVVDPEEGAVRIVIFAAMAALLVVALCVPEAFGDLALTFAVGYGLVRAGHIALFLLASRGDPALRHSVATLAASTAVGVGLLVGAAYLDGAAQGGMWGLALALDMAGPFFFGAEGWKLVPGHFAERHGLIIIIALGESIVAVGAGSEVGVDAGVIVAAVLGIALASAQWWAYFDVVAYVAARRLTATPVGREQNELARDSYSYLHFPMVAGIVLVALGMKKTIANVDDPLKTVAAFALVGGLGIYLLAHVAFRFRNFRTVNKQRLIVGALLFALFPVTLELPALVALALVTGLVCGMIAYEAIRFAEARAKVRHDVWAEPPS
ncbi:MAG: low temperature requirement protein A [Actinomycetota bacterium]|nr:low temperature requirement protein A [Actinomycetota bacterium]